MENSNYVKDGWKDLEKYREEIDLIDDKIIELLVSRQNAVLALGKIKEALGIQVIDLSREQQIIRRLASIEYENLGSDSINRIYSEIFSTARSLQQKIIVSYLGPEASFSHQAARYFYGHGASFQASYNIEDVFVAVENGDCDFGVVPIENSCEGSVRNTLDLFFKYDLKICAEIFIRIRHHLLSKACTIQGINQLYSHAMAFAQCSSWIKSNMPRVPVVEVESTATAARIAAERPSAAAIGSMDAGLANGLNSLEKNIEDNPGNTTRFIVIGNIEAAPTGKDKTSLLLLLGHKPGALYSALKPFSERNINVLKIESRPSGTKRWEYLFFFDIEGHEEDPNVKMAIKEMEEYTVFLRRLGSYPEGGSSRA